MARMTTYLVPPMHPKVLGFTDRTERCEVWLIGAKMSFRKELGVTAVYLEYKGDKTYARIVLAEKLPDGFSHIYYNDAFVRKIEMTSPDRKVIWIDNRTSVLPDANKISAVILTTVRILVGEVKDYKFELDPNYRPGLLSQSPMQVVLRDIVGVAPRFLFNEQKNILIISS